MRGIKLSLGSPAFKTLVVGRHSLLLVLMLIVALSITACGRRPQPPEVEATPASGSVEAPAEDEATSSEAITDTATVEETTSDADGDTAETGNDAANADTPEEEAVASMAAGMQVVIVYEAGTRVRADAGDDAPVLHLFSAGEVMEILEPSGDYDAYPVTVDEIDWVRVRAADGLVGWVAMDAIEAAE